MQQAHCKSEEADRVYVQIVKPKKERKAQVGVCVYKFRLFSFLEK